MARKNTSVLSNQSRMKNKKTTKLLDITLTENKMHIKLNKLI